MKPKLKQYNPSLETLHRWKNTSAKAKLEWLEESLVFFKKINTSPSPSTPRNK